MKSTDLLQACADVQLERGKQYDAQQTGERSFQAAAQAFNALTGSNLKGSDVCLMLVCVKAVRQYSDPSRVHDDSVLDLVSYAALWGEELYSESRQDWPDETRIDIIGSNGNDGSHYNPSD